MNELTVLNSNKRLILYCLSLKEREKKKRTQVYVHLVIHAVSLNERAEWQMIESDTRGDMNAAVISA